MSDVSVFSSSAVVVADTDRVRVGGDDGSKDSDDESEMEGVCEMLELGEAPDDNDPDTVDVVEPDCDTDAVFELLSDSDCVTDDD